MAISDPEVVADRGRQRPCARSTCSMHSRTAPRPPPLGLTQCTAARTSGGGVGRRGGEARAPQHRQVLQVVAHVADLRVGQRLSPRRICSYPASLFADALDDDVDAELRGADRRGVGGSRRQQADRQPGALRPHDRRRRRGCGTASTRCRRRARGSCRRSARRRRRSSSSRTCSGVAHQRLRTSACATDRAGARRLRPCGPRRRRRPT